MAIPLYGFMEGDTVSLLILAEETDTLQILGRKLQDAAAIRVRGINPFQVVHHDKAVDPALTVSEAGFQALDRFDVVSSEQR
jgi:toluene-4-monooxygenase system protein B